jgi:hypothetical protein
MVPFLGYGIMFSSLAHGNHIEDVYDGAFMPYEAIVNPRVGRVIPIL